MAGLIRKDDIEAVRNAARIEEIVGDHVTLKPAGIGSLKGLCPFHDERTPSFNVRPAVGMFHCFGCGESGDVISFVQKIDHLPFAEAVEVLAAKTGITLHYEEGGARVRTEEPGRRGRLVDAHRIAEEFYQSQLTTSQAAKGREFLAGRGFTQAMCAHFGVGYAPRSWDALIRHLRSRGYTDQEIQTAGLASQGARGIYDRFRGRLVWPIRDITGATVGFGARRLDDDEDSPKYLNTPETPIYKKSQLLYGLDLAKKAITQGHRVVIVEGYTDVMAAHVAGVDCAVATCGTAFGPEHVKIIRRLLGDSADPAAGVVLASGRAHGSEVIFTFDGDSAGQKAALRAYGEDQNFAAQTFVAVAPGGQDPCELRLSQGDQAVVDLVRSRTPLFEFAIRSVLSGVDLRSAEGRIAGLRSSARIVAHIKDRALRREYARQLAGWLGMDTRTVDQAVHAASRRGPDEAPARPGAPTMAGAGRPGPSKGRDWGAEDPVGRVERQALEAVLQHPALVIGAGFDELDGAAFTVPTHRAVHDAIRASGGLDEFTRILRSAEEHFGPGEEATAAATRRFVSQVLEAAGDYLAPAVSQLAVAPLPVADHERMRSYCRGVVAAMARVDLTRSLGQARAALQRMGEDDPGYAEAFRELMRLEQRRQNYTERD